MIIVGEKDVDPPESYVEWEAAFPNAHLVLIDGAGHYPHVEQPKKFFKMAKEFINDE